MKLSTIKLFIVELVLISFLLLNFFVINITNLYIISIFLLLPMTFVILFLGFEKNRQRFRKDIILSVIAYTFLFQLVLYLLGLFVGFLRNGYSLTFMGIIKNTIPILIIIFVSEILRYCINIKGQKNIGILIGSVIIFVLLDITLQTTFKSLNGVQSITELINLIALPSISKNVLLTYFSYEFGYQSTICYRFIMEIPVFFIPIIPNLNNYLNAIFYFFFPLLFAFVTYKKITKYNYEEELPRGRKKNVVGFVVALVILFIVVFLTSGIGPAYALVIGSGSMKDTINVGDVVIVKKVKQEKMATIEESNVLVYKHDNKVIAHRIVEIKEDNDKLFFQTKGDNNEEKDLWTVDQTDVIGIVKYKIPYIGYPTVWLNGIE